jgi:hypothetical protein
MAMRFLRLRSVGLDALPPCRGIQHDRPIRVGGPCASDRQVRYVSPVRGLAGACCDRIRLHSGPLRHLGPQTGVPISARAHEREELPDRLFLPRRRTALSAQCYAPLPLMDQRNRLKV